jgi:hypothetical protein
VQISTTFFEVGDRRFLDTVELDVLLDELDRAVARRSPPPRMVAPVNQ